MLVSARHPEQPTLCGVGRTDTSLLIRLFQRSGSMRVKLIKENEDGSASYLFDLDADEADSLLRLGILEAIKAGIRDGDLLKVEGEDVSS